NNLLGENQADWLDATKFVAAPYRSGVIARFAWGAISGEGEGVAGHAGDIVLSVAPVIGLYADFRDIALAVCDWSTFGWDGVDKFQLGASVAGVVLELTPADLLVDAIKKIGQIRKWVGPNAPLVQVLGGILKNALSTGNWEDILKFRNFITRIA